MSDSAYVDFNTAIWRYFEIAYPTTDLYSGVHRSTWGQSILGPCMSIDPPRGRNKLLHVIRYLPVMHHLASIAAGKKFLLDIIRKILHHVCHLQLPIACGRKRRAQDVKAESLGSRTRSTPASQYHNRKTLSLYTSIPNRLYSTLLLPKF